MTLHIQKLKHLRAHKDRVSARQYNQLVDIVMKMSQSLMINGVADSSGFITRRTPTQAIGKPKIFTVLNTTPTGDGVYNCYEQKLLSAEWDDVAGDDRLDNQNTTEIEVLNLFESHCNATYTAQLQADDMIKASKFTDDAGNSRWVGVPLMGGFLRQAKTQEAAPADTKISVKLVDQDDNEIGSAFDVNCRTTLSANLNAAVPRLASGDYISVFNIAGKWWCNQIFPASEDCTCTAP